MNNIDTFIVTLDMNVWLLINLLLVAYVGVLLNKCLKKSYLAFGASGRSFKLLEPGFKGLDLFVVSFITIVSILIGLLLHPLVRTSSLGLDEPVMLLPPHLFFLLELVHAGQDVGLAELRRPVDVELKVSTSV